MSVDLPLIPTSVFPADDHAVCPFDGLLMSFDAARGELTCPECGCTAQDAAAHLLEVRS
ncbi:MAG TPA: hypothetical protein VI172_14865 [Candidatus Dormibacteraeota bacterium]|jgi:hypothetical protein